MRTPNIQAIRKQLPRGSLAQIADNVGLSRKQISEFFNRGWHPQYTNAIVTQALEIIKGQYPDDQVLEDAEELGLTGGSVVFKKKTRAPRASNDGGSTIIIIGLLAFLVYFFWDKIKALWTKEPEGTK